METAKLGVTPTKLGTRDAIHVAIVSVTSPQALYPGTVVGLLEDGTVGKTEGTPVGIVDPFRVGLMQPGTVFWLCLFPESITGMRHVWTHPAFTTKIPEALKVK